MFRHGIYIGPEHTLRGKTALLQRPYLPCMGGPSYIEAQFDDMSLELKGRKLGFSWHEFRQDHFLPYTVEGS